MKVTGGKLSNSVPGIGVCSVATMVTCCGVFVRRECLFRALQRNPVMTRQFFILFKGPWKFALSASTESHSDDVMTFFEMAVSTPPRAHHDFLWSCTFLAIPRCRRWKQGVSPIPILPTMTCTTLLGWGNLMKQRVLSFLGDWWWHMFYVWGLLAFSEQKQRLWAQNVILKRLANRLTNFISLHV